LPACARARGGHLNIRSDNQSQLPLRAGARKSEGETADCSFSSPRARGREPRPTSQLEKLPRLPACARTLRWRTNPDRHRAPAPRVRAEGQSALCKATAENFEPFKHFSSLTGGVAR